jgi:hypothetical protein
MSIVGMARDALIHDANRPGLVVQPDGTLAEVRGAGGDGGPPPDPDQNNRVTNALNLLIKYIPTESVTLYVAALAAAPALRARWPIIDGETLYWTFGVILTPALLLLVYASKRKSVGRSFPSLYEWPWWKMLAATLAFLAWALAVPNNPYIRTAADGAIAAFLAVFVSTILSLVESIVES